MGYSDWSIYLADHFFGPKNAGEGVRLNVTAESLNQEFNHLGGFRGFCESVRNGPEWIGSGDDTLHVRALATYQNHYCRELVLERFSDDENYHETLHKTFGSYPDIPYGVPSFLPYLCLLCLAWTEGGGELAGGAYYERLDPLYEGHELDTEKLKELKCLWDHLEKWSTDSEGKYGVWRVQILGQLQHVGIPKSQVLLTAPKIKRLPELFHYCNIPAGQDIPATVIGCMLQGSPYTSSILGNVLAGAIQANNEIGKYALELLSEHHLLWDGAYDREANQAHTDRTRYIRLRLLFQPVNNTKWQLHLGISHDDEGGIILVDPEHWQLVGKTAALRVLSRYNDPFDANDFKGILESGTPWEIPCRQDEDDSEGDALLRLRNVEVRYFSSCRFFAFVEQDSFFGEDSCYIMLKLDEEHKLLEWVEKHHDRAHITPYPWPGLPAGWTIYHVDKLSSLELAATNEFPWKTDPVVGSKETGKIKFIGGSPKIGGTARLTYLAYDPPDIEIELNSKDWEAAKITPHGGDLELLLDDQSESILPGKVSKLFKVDPLEKTSTFQLTISLPEGEPISRNFALEHGHGGQTFIDDEFKVDKFGIGSTTGRVRGTSVEVSNVPRYNTVELGVINWSVDADAKESKVLELLEAFSLSRKRWRFKEFKISCSRICGLEDLDALDLLGNLKCLGFVDIEVNIKGNMTHIHPSPLVLYRLPYVHNTMPVYALSGCGTIEKWDYLINLIKGLGGLVSLQDHEVTRSPVLLVATSKIQSVEGKIRDAGIKVSKNPPALGLMEYSCDIGTWLKERTTSPFPGVGPDNPGGGYSPYSLRVQKVQYLMSTSAPFRLNYITDIETGKHKNYYCVRSRELEDLPPEHFFIMDESWAKWMVQNRFCSAEECPVPYCTKTRRLVIPGGLRLPVLLERALCLCSGKSPDIIYGFKPFEDLHHGLLPDDEDNVEPYRGACLVYRDVPIEVALDVLKKVNAKPMKGVYFE